MTGVTTVPSRSPGWLRIIFGTASTSAAADTALAVARAALAWVFIYYGGQKLFGFFPGAGPHGIHQTAQYFSSAAHLHPGRLFAILGGIAEFGGGVAMALGFCARLAGLVLFGDMVVAIVTVTWAQGFNSVTTPPGYDLNIVVAALALVMVLMGAGRLSVDALISRQLLRAGPTARLDAPVSRIPARAPH